jgi:orotate phosphoribosyltransferase-like protein
MTHEETIARIRELRGRGLSPKEIARSLGVRRAVVTDVVRALAAQRDDLGNRDEGVDCPLNAG